jgi:outer membrane receptor protein involved in Fe transport
MKRELLFILTLAGSLAFAQTTPPTATPQPDIQQTSVQKLPPVQQTIEVTATRLPENPEEVPVGIQVFSGEELGERGIRDMRGVIGLATGVSVAPGGDAGPASFVPQFWGLQEMDAYLLVVDGVPWGGPFNPATSALNLSDIDRVEVLRGPAPVMYGATSFVGVIQVVHKNSALNQRSLNLWGGSYSTGGGSFSTPIPMSQNWTSRLTLEGQNQGYSNQRTSYARGHGIWNVEHKTSATNYQFLNIDINWLNQNPYTPRPRSGGTLDPNVLPDSNQNMAGAFLNDHRFSFYGGLNREVGNGYEWSTTVSYAPSRQNILHGFLLVPEEIEDNARGIRENIQQNELYADSHLSWKAGRSVRVIVGADYLFGLAHAQGADFEYTAPLSGIPAPVVEVPDDLDFHINDTRNFVGFYGTTEWTPFERLRIDLGIRLNVTSEYQQVIDGGAGTQDQQTQNNVKPGANVGLMFTAWQSGSNSIGLYANYRYTFKPAAIDFGIGEEEEGGGGDLILQPETSWSVESGMKGRFLNGKLELEASGFYMDFNNLVTPTSVNGIPELINAGHERFTGFESGGRVFLPKNFIIRGTYSYHKANFIDFVQDFDGVPTQLAGKRIEMSPNNLAGGGIMYSPPKGFFGNFQVIYTGSRYLNKRNTALAGGFTTLEAGIGYRVGRWEFVVNGRNLTDARDPVSESELGDAQYYLMTSRRIDAGLRIQF